MTFANTNFVAMIVKTVINFFKNNNIKELANIIANLSAIVGTIYLFVSGWFNKIFRGLNPFGSTNEDDEDPDDIIATEVIKKKRDPKRAQRLNQKLERIRYAKKHKYDRIDSGLKDVRKGEKKRHLYKRAHWKNIAPEEDFDDPDLLDEEGDPMGYYFYDDDEGVDIMERPLSDFIWEVDDREDDEFDDYMKRLSSLTRSELAAMQREDKVARRNRDLEAEEEEILRQIREEDERIEREKKKKKLKTVGLGRMKSKKKKKKTKNPEKNRKLWKGVDY